MDQQYSTGTVDRPIRATDGPGPSEQGADLVDDVSESSPSWANSVLGNMESVIQQYPWPTLLLGIGIGYLAARRVR
jgi:hypothetical protein